MKFKSLFITALLLMSILLASCEAATETPVVTEPPEVEEVVTPEPTEEEVAPTEVPTEEAVATPEVVYPPAPEYIEIGASIPLTGKFGSLGSQVKVGYDYAIADINAAGGVFVAEYGTKIPLRLTAYDDESDPTKAVSNLENVFSDQQVVA